MYAALNYSWRPRFAVPAEAGAAEKLRVFLEKLFQLNFGPVGWLSFDTTLVCVCMRGWVGVICYLQIIYCARNVGPVGWL